MTIPTDPVSRRTTLKTWLAVATAGLAVGGARSALAGQAYAQEKLAQNIVQYQTTPKDGAECSKCVNFQPPNACAIVAGDINPNGWCVAFAPKSS